MGTLLQSKVGARVLYNNTTCYRLSIQVCTAHKNEASVNKVLVDENDQKIKSVKTIIFSVAQFLHTICTIFFER